ncbi:MAG: D-2-hydroxyacid dehydrogenase family protein [Nocardioides sp.]
MADWSSVRRLGEVDRFTDHVTDPEGLVERLMPYDVVVLMRERTPFPAAVIDRLPGLRLVVTTGRKNPSIDIDAARRRGIVVCGTQSLATAPGELTWALILAWSRHLVCEVANVRAGRWQSTVGRDLAGRTLGVVGLGRIGGQVATVGRAFGMEVVAWSQNLTQDRAAEVGARVVPLDALLVTSDVVTVHQVLSDRTRGLIGTPQLARMKSDALLVNTSRAPIVDVDAIVSALREGRLGGAALDVFEDEPLADTDPLRTTPGLLLTPHLGYVTEAVYRRFFSGVVEDILAFAAGVPIRTL